MATSEIPPAEQSVAGIVDLQHQIAEAHTPHGTSVGKIIAPPPNIEIAWNNIILTKERIYIDEYLLIGHKRMARGHIESQTQIADCGCGGQHLHSIDDPYTESWILTDTLKPGDLVEVTPIKGDQLFIVKCKLIYLGDR